MSGIRDIMQVILQRTFGDKIKYIHSCDYESITHRWSVNWVDNSGARRNIHIDAETVECYADSCIFSNDSSSQAKDIKIKWQDPCVPKNDNSLSKCSKFLWK